jgi:hypothetical protein
MYKEHKQNIERLLKLCPEGCECYELGVGLRCKAIDVGLESYVLCLEETHWDSCPFCVSYGREHFCKCPIIVHAAKTVE